MANFATQALKTAQKRIDKVLDIKEEETGMDELVKSLNFEIRLACDDVECFCLILNVVGHLLIFKNKFSAKYSPYKLPDRLDRQFCYLAPFSGLGPMVDFMRCLVM